MIIDDIDMIVDTIELFFLFYYPPFFPKT